MDKTFTAQLIASAIQANCDNYNARRIDYVAWDAEQRRLWKRAERRRGVANEVCRLVAPKLGAAR